MKKVNEEKLLLDHAELVAKREANLAEIEKQATIYAIDRGYSEEKTAQFIAFTKELEGDGLSAEENAKLELLESYIEEVEDPAVETEVDETEATAEATVATSPTTFYGI